MEKTTSYQMNNKIFHSSDYQILIKDLINNSISELKNIYYPFNRELSLCEKVNKRKSLKRICVKNRLISIIGLNKAEIHGFDTEIDIREILDSEIEKCHHYNSIGEVGLLLWASALIAPETLEKILVKIKFEKKVSRYKDYKSQKTLELSWFLTGVLLAKTFNPNFRKSIGTLHLQIYELIKNNYNWWGLFNKQKNQVLTRKSRDENIEFEDQVFAIIALTLFSKQTNNTESLVIAKGCAKKISDLQKNDGEWSLGNYDKNNCSLKYQDLYFNSIAAMALFPIQRASNYNFEKYITRGMIHLIEKKNKQLSTHRKKDISKEMQTIDLARNALNIKPLHQLMRLNKFGSPKTIAEFSISHHGWLLYAFAGRVNDKLADETREVNPNLILYDFRKN